MHADGSAGYEEFYRDHRIKEVACMAHIRRKFVDVHRSEGSAIAEEAIRRIAGLYAIEKEARGSPLDRRAAIRKAKARPIFDEPQDARPTASDLGKVPVGPRHQVRPDADAAALAIPFQQHCGI